MHVYLNYYKKNFNNYIKNFSPIIYKKKLYAKCKDNKLII